MDFWRSSNNKDLRLENRKFITVGFFCAAGSESLSTLIVDLLVLVSYLHYGSCLVFTTKMIELDRGGLIEIV